MYMFTVKIVKIGTLRKFVTAECLAKVEIKPQITLIPVLII